jgi:hypothetical protein
MPRPISRRNFLRRIRNFGCTTPEAGGSHQYVYTPTGKKVAIPNPHAGDYDWSLVKRLLKQLGIDPGIWDSLD